MFPSFSRLVRTASVVAALALAPSALAEEAEYGTSYVFTTVDALLGYSLGGGFEVTGILEGEATPRTIRFWSSGGNYESQQGFGARCDRMALLLMTRPGRFRLTVEMPSSLQATTCMLTRLP
ncbi:hypothetical protein HV824_01380 [Myxococcus sp. AM009]|uniref:hypothetical protein n=1 Tax=unclassified Myxococcus TaxID=2648731 RepID=UPI001595A63C|nr:MULTISPECIES: hypothetical protein [unclassified Myxococcus]NVI96778.1 hypothetical protein [Myxococcus sp. AM009]NVJ16304.1 hypothetical protein [Myxococcus sp. AM010]